MTQRPGRWLVPLVALLLLAGCGGTEVNLGSGEVPVNTAKLRALKHSAGVEPCTSTRASAADGGLPAVTLPCLGGGPGVSLARLRGPLVVNLWAQWCGPCRTELPIYQRFAEKYAGKVGVLGVDWNDHRPDLALQEAKRTGVTYPQVADQNMRVRALGHALPQLVLVDADGRIAYQHAQRITSLAQLERLVHRHLGVGA